MRQIIEEIAEDIEDLDRVVVKPGEKYKVLDDETFLSMK